MRDPSGLRAYLYIAATLAGLAVSSDSSAQITGTVTDPNGRALSSATVELRSGAEILLRTWSDSLGAFRLAAVNRSNDLTVAVSRLGHAQSIVRVADPDRPITVVLSVAPVALDAITAVSSRPCPNAEDSRARTLWQESASRYSGETAGRSTSARIRYLEERQISASSLGQVDADRLRPRLQANAGATAIPTAGRYLHIDVMVAKDGYAAPTGMSDPKFRILRLDSRHAHHFLSAEFGRRHTLAVVSESENESVVSFCPRSRRDVGIEGSLFISKDRSLLEAEWEYDANRLGVRAGGQATFMEVIVPGEDEPHLMPATSRFWEESRDHPGWYSQTWTVFVRWVVGRSGEVGDW